MFDKNLYKETFSKIETNTQIETQKVTEKPKRKFGKRALVIAVVACLLVGATGVVAVGSGVFSSVKDLVVPDDVQYERDPISQRLPRDPVPTGILVKDTSLQGLPGSPEYEADIEWRRFMLEFDEQPILDVIQNNPTEFDIPYKGNAYCQEMADKLDELTAKYNLELIDKYDCEANFGDTVDEGPIISEKLGIGQFLDDRIVSRRSTYIFGNGTFRSQAAWVMLDNDFKAGLDIFHTKKGYLWPGLGGIVQIDTATLEEWNYVTKSGVEVLVALSDREGYIIADLQKSFVTIAVRGNEDASVAAAETPFKDVVNREAMEQIADMIDFAELNKQK